jgi:hypothetical protein
VEEHRIRGYLLNLNHADGGPKARFFLARGFTVDAWDVLQASLIIQGRTNTVTTSIDTEWEHATRWSAIVRRRMTATHASGRYGKWKRTHRAC